VDEINGRKPCAEDPQEDLDITLPRFRIELTSPEEGIGRVSHVHASSMEDALRKVRDPDRWCPTTGPGSDPNRFRIVEALEDNDLTETRQQKNARRRYLNIITEAGLRALGRTHPHRSEEDHFDEPTVRRTVADTRSQGVTARGARPGSGCKGSGGDRGSDRQAAAARGFGKDDRRRRDSPDGQL